MSNLAIRMRRIMSGMSGISRWLITTLLMIVVYIANATIFVDTEVSLAPYIPFVVFASFMGRSTGIYAVLLSAALGCDFLPPENVSNVLGYVISAILTALTVSVLSLSYEQAERERVKAERTVQETSLLLAEISHRVKNDIAMLAAALQTQARNADHPKAAEAFNAAAQRTMVFGRIHRRLAQTNAGLVNVGDMLRGLCDEMRNIVPKNIRLIVEAEDADMPVKAVSSIGLIANELITNALKYAFPNRRSGIILVEFRRDEHEYVLRVTDNGDGFKEGLGSGSGRRIVRALVSQLRGYLDIGSNGGVGVKVEVRFPVSTQLSAAPLPIPG